MAKKRKIDIPEDIKKKCMAIIHGAATAAGATGTGLAQIPLADSAVITPIQIGMIIALGKVFGQEIKDNVAKGIIAGAGASIVGRGISQVLCGWIPVVGNAINTATAAGLTEAIGWIAVDKFAKEYINIEVCEIGNCVETEVLNGPHIECICMNDIAFEENELASVDKEIEAFLSKTKNPKDNGKEYDSLMEALEKMLENVDVDTYNEYIIKYNELKSLKRA